MGTALTQEQLAELAKVGAGTVAASCPRARRGPRRAGGDAARGAAGRGSAGSTCGSSRCRRAPTRRISWRREGSEAFGKLLDVPFAMIEFQVRRVLADADLDTPAGRDRALEEARELISASTRTDRYTGRARPRSRGPARRSRGLRAGSPPALRRGRSPAAPTQRVARRAVARAGARVPDQLPRRAADLGHELPEQAGPTSSSPRSSLARARELTS